MKRRRVRKKAKALLLLLFFLISFILVELTVAFVTVYIWQEKSSVVSPIGKAEEEKENNTLEEALSNEKISFSHIQVASDSSYIVTLTEGEKVIFSQDKSPKEQVQSLQLIISKLTIEGKKVRSIDFRFDKPVMIFK